MATARLLTEAGVRIHSVDEERGLLVRSDEAARAREVLAGSAGARAVNPLDRPIDATVEIPGSKSHTNRALLCAALATGRSRLSRVLIADDTEAMLGALAAHAGESWMGIVAQNRMPGILAASICGTLMSPSTIFTLAAAAI